MARLVSFWGKGGVGKSTVAAAASIYLRGRGLRVLAVSTDPSPSLGLLLCGRPGVRWEECSGVTVFEASEEDVRRLWVERFGDEVYEVVSAFLPVGREIVDYVAGAPGISDQYTMYLVYELAGRDGYDVVVWDTAAAGGSLRLLRLERELYTHLGEAARLYLRVRGSLSRLRRGSGGRDPLSLIEEWRRLAEGIMRALASDSHAAFVVAAPDELSLATTRMLVEELRLHGIEPRALVVNKLVDPGQCPGCTPWLEDAEAQARVLPRLRRLAGRVCLLPRLAKRPASAADLAGLVERLGPCLGVAAGRGQRGGAPPGPGF